MALESDQPSTEISTTNLPASKGRPASMLKTSAPTMSRLSTKCSSLDVSKPYGPPRSVKGIALPLFLLYKNLILFSNLQDFGDMQLMAFEHPVFEF
jgi:hypothetical protein